MICYPREIRELSVDMAEYGATSNLLSVKTFGWSKSYIHYLY